MPKLETGAAGAIVGLSLVELFKMYKDTAPDLTDIRDAPAHDYGMRQKLMDTNILVGSMAILVGTAMSYLAGTIIPAALMLAGFTLIAVYYYMVCHSPSPNEVSNA